MKLTKENIYVPLEGYSEEERIEIVEFLLSINEPCKGFLKIHIKRNKTLEFWGGTWFTNHSAGNKTPVTIKQLKEILQPMENKGEQFEKAEETLTLENVKVDCRGLTGKEIVKISDIIYNKKGTRPMLTANGYIVHGHQPIRTIISYEKFMELFDNKEETLQEKEQRLLKELGEVRKEIEDSKIKVGDWVWNSSVNTFYKKSYNTINQHERKITNPQLIELLENEIK